MSYHPVPPRGALGTLLDANPFTSAYYIALVEQVNSQTGARGYGWSNYRYLSPWDAVSFANGYDQTNFPVTQQASLYQWTGSNWAPTSIQSTI